MRVLTKVVPVRFRVDELDECRAVAAAEGLPFNRWVRRACREAAGLERVLMQQEERPFRPDFK